MRLVCISDTHNQHNDTAPPDGDVLIHAGDFTSAGSQHEIRAFAQWIGDQPHRHKLVIAGNHDLLFESHPRAAESLLLGAATYLRDSGIRIGGHLFYGSPWQPRFGDWAFNLPRMGGELERIYARIPDDTDVLITHGPPHGVLDRCPHPVGCEVLARRVAVVRPSVHIFGHIHEGHGMSIANGSKTASINAAICDRNYRPTNPPIVIDLDGRP